jgi:hypothetical protein
MMLLRTTYTHADPAQFMSALAGITVASRAFHENGEIVLRRLDGQRFALWQSGRRAWQVDGKTVSHNGATLVSWRFASPVENRLLLRAFNLAMFALAIGGIALHEPAQLVACTMMLIFGMILLTIRARHGHPAQQSIERLIRRAAHDAVQMQPSTPVLCPTLPIVPGISAPSIVSMGSCVVADR